MTARVDKMLEEELTKRLKPILGDPVTVIFSGLVGRYYQWTVFSRLFGRRARFDLELEHELLEDDHAVDILVAQLPEQIMDEHERDLIHGYTAYFDVDRQYTTGIIRNGNEYKPEKWRYPRLPKDENGWVHNNLDDKIGGLYAESLPK